MIINHLDSGAVSLSSVKVKSPSGRSGAHFLCDGDGFSSIELPRGKYARVWLQHNVCSCFFSIKRGSATPERML